MVIRPWPNASPGDQANGLMLASLPPRSCLPAGLSAGFMGGDLPGCTLAQKLWHAEGLGSAPPGPQPLQSWVPSPCMYVAGDVSHDVITASVPSQAALSSAMEHILWHAEWD